MKYFLKGALLMIGVLALILGVRFAAFFPIHHEAMAVKDPALITAAALSSRNMISSLYLWVASRAFSLIRCREWRRVLRRRGIAVQVREKRDAYGQDQCEHGDYHQCPFDKIFHGFTLIYILDSLHFKQAAVKIR